MKRTEKEKTALSVGADGRRSVTADASIIQPEIILPNSAAKDKRFILKDGKTLLTEPISPTRFVVESLIPQGLHILAGEPKVGKSWLALDLCLKVATGDSLWKFPVAKGTALYLCLEDSELRIQNRIYDLVEFDDSFNENDYACVHFSTHADFIGCGLERQIENFIAEHSDVKIIVIDTLQRIRNISNDNAYANDYRELGILKSLADKYGIAIVIIHHLCKQPYDRNPFNRISGTSAISGAADSSFVLTKDKYNSSKAALSCIGRDIEQRELELIFDAVTHKWNLVADSIAEPEKFLVDDLKLLVDFIMERKLFDGTPNELAELISSSSGANVFASGLSKKLLRNKYELEELGVFSSHRKSNGKRLLTLEFKPLETKNSDGRDGKYIPVSRDPAVPDN